MLHVQTTAAGVRGKGSEMNPPMGSGHKDHLQGQAGMCLVRGNSYEDTALCHFVPCSFLW